MIGLNLIKDLLTWYDRFKRDLPWRGPMVTPYQVYVSEIMLQQTTVATCIPYFQKFIAKFPDWNALSKAPIDDVLKAWEGLGYYRRAHNMHQCAKRVVLLGLPDTFEGLIKLPGVGIYTANALASMVFGHPTLPLDGNIRRILSRLFEVDTIPQKQPFVSKKPKDVPHAFMDLGSLICKPKNPNCLLCPLQNHCSSYKNHTVFMHPKKKVVKNKPKLYGDVFFITNNNDEIWIEKGNSSMLQGLYQMPLSHFKEVPSPYVLRHSFTHFSLYLDLVYTSIPPKEGFWVPFDKLSLYPFSKLMQKAFKFGFQSLTNSL